VDSPAQAPSTGGTPDLRRRCMKALLAPLLSSSQRLISSIMRGCTCRGSRDVQSFLRNQAEGIWCCDLFEVRDLCAWIGSSGKSPSVKRDLRWPADRGLAIVHGHDVGARRDGSRSQGERAQSRTPRDNYVLFWRATTPTPDVARLAHSVLCARRMSWRRRWPAWLFVISGGCIGPINCNLPAFEPDAAIIGCFDIVNNVTNPIGSTEACYGACAGTKRTCIDDNQGGGRWSAGPRQSQGTLSEQKRNTLCWHLVSSASEVPGIDIVDGTKATILAGGDHVDVGVVRPRAGE
jgi:hypothetical protein